MKKPFFFLLLIGIGSFSGLMGQANIKELTKQAWAQFEATDYEAAFLTSKDILFEDPENAEGFAIRGSILAVYDRRTDAMENLNYAIDHGTKSARAYMYRGYIHHYFDRYAQAEADFNKAIAMDKDLLNAYRLRGRMYADKEDFVRALADFDRCIKERPDLPGFYYDKGMAYFEMGEFATAAKQFEQVAVRDTAHDFPAELRLGICAYFQDDFAKAERYYKQAVALKPDSPVAYFNLGLLEVNRGSYELGITYYNKAIAADSSYAPAYGSKGRALYLMDRYAEAIPVLDSAIDFGGSDIEIFYMNRGNCKLELGQYEGAIQDYSKVIVRDLNNIDAYMYRGKARKALKAFDKAKEDFRMCLKLNPEFAEAEFYLALTQMAAQDNATAKASFLKYLKQHPDDSRGWFNLGTINRALNLPAEAVENFTTALATHNFDSITTYYRRSMAHLENGNKKSSNADIDTCMTFETTDAYMLSTIGYTLNLLDRPTEALDFLNRSIALDTTYAYAYNNRGFAKYKLGDYKSAIADFDRSIALKNDYFYWPPWNRANAKRALGLYEAAIEDFNLSLGYKADHPEALNDRGETWEKLGKIDLAIADYEAALALKPEFETAKANLKRLKP